MMTVLTGGKMVRSWFAFLILWPTVLIGQELAPSRQATHSIVFSGDASGGQLTFAKCCRRNADYVSITNMPGDPVAKVVMRLASAINASDSGREIVGGIVSAKSNSVGQLPGFPYWGRFILGGTEVGLGIPPPPTSLSASYSFESDIVKLNWVNPLGGYESIAVLADGVCVSILPGNSTAYEHKDFTSFGTTLDVNDVDYHVVGYRGQVPSNAGAIHLTGDSQEELINLPFTRGIAPNWNAWSNNLQSAEVNFDLGIKPKVRRNAFFKTPDKKPFYQHISGSGETFVCGTWRKCLGVQPGSTYKISVRMNTLGLSFSPNWTFSAHAAHNGTSGKTLTVDQLSGLSPLPDRSSGVGAGRIVEYGGTNTTGSKWMLLSTDIDGPGKVIGNITLPAGVDTITVWTRLTGNNISLSGVGIDWVAVEKLRGE